MITEEIEYKGKIYNVTNPGEIIYSTKTLVRGLRTDKRYEIVDQLDGCSEIKFDRKTWQGSRVKYLQIRYGITELDYYIIVVCRGDESLLPKCSYVNPYTGESCNKPKKFRTLTPGKYQRTGKRKGIFHDGCSEHTRMAATQISQRENYIKGVTGLQKADRRSKEWRQKLSEHAKKQMENGESIFSPDEIRKSGIPSWKEFQYPSMNYFREAAASLGLNNCELSLDKCILIDKVNFLSRGKPDDICVYYISSFEETEDIFKLGVTIDLEERIKKGEYHGYKYKTQEILFSSTRENIAEIEFNVKMKFKQYIILGNEGFESKYKDEILEYIKELIKTYN